MFQVFWRILTKKVIRVDGRSWPWPTSHFERRLLKHLFRLSERLVRDIEIIDRGPCFKFRCTTRSEFKRCATMFIKEPQTCEWIKSEVKAGQVFYDIGANIGIYSILAAKYVGGVGRVYAFEPHNANFSRLLDNIAANGLGEIVVPCNLALYSRDEFFALRLSDRPGRIIRQPTSFSDRK
jgi:hypothetical protein